MRKELDIAGQPEDKEAAICSKAIREYRLWDGLGHASDHPRFYKSSKRTKFLSFE